MNKIVVLLALLVAAAVSADNTMHLRKLGKSPKTPSVTKAPSTKAPSSTKAPYGQMTRAACGINLGCMYLTLFDFLLLSQICNQSTL